MSDGDTICAIATPPGAGGIGIVRVSGPRALDAVAPLFRFRSGRQLHAIPSHTMHYGHVIEHAAGEIVDEALVCVMRAPSTYTREDVVEIQCHGGSAPLRRTMELLLAAGVRQAEPGEFTLRAFLNGRIDLTQAEAVMDIIAAKTDLSRRSAAEMLSGGLSREVGLLRDQLVALLAAVEAGIDFPEEDLETEQPVAALIDALVGRIDDLVRGFTYGRILREGFATAIVGRPNVGKSSLLNALLRQDRAIVTDIPGTTRDVLEEYLNIAGIPFRILDTAGIRHATDAIEREGIRRSRQALQSADIALVVLERSARMTEEDRNVLDSVRGIPHIVVLNKSDLPSHSGIDTEDASCVAVSCKTGDGLEELRKLLAEAAIRGTACQGEHTWSINQRHKAALDEARELLLKARHVHQAGLSPEFVALDLRGALDALGRIVGAVYTEDILEQIFSTFCIGK